MSSSADSEARAAFRAMLSAERAGYKLSVALVSTLVSYLVGTAELSDVSELDMSTLLTTATEAWAATHEGADRSFGIAVQGPGRRWLRLRRSYLGAG